MPFFRLLFGCIFTLSAIAFAQTTESAGVAPAPPSQPPQAHEGLSGFLAEIPKPPGPEADVPYAKVPPELSEAVSMIATDNFTSAAQLLHKNVEELPPDSTEKATALMWLGIAYGSQAINYPSTGWQSGTSATTYLKQAIEIDPHVIEAPDVARIFAEMVAHGWATEDPATALDRAVQKAEETRRPIDFYFAGVISRRLAARAWGYSDTTEQDKKTLALFAKSIARDPSRYETWSAYLPAMMPAGMHDLATTEAAAMLEHFGNLRTPLLADQGPAVLMINTSSFRTNEQNEALLQAVAEKWPDAPMPPFETAMRAIETSQALALELFPKLIERFESGSIKPLPREAGYYPSALYKYAFLLQSIGKLNESIAVYKKVRDISPGYAEVNLNIGILYAIQSDAESTGPRKLALLEKALPYVQQQEELDYRGRAALKAGEMRQRLRSLIYRMKQAQQAADSPTTSTQ